VILAPESVASFAALLADRSRAAICLALLDGRAWTAAELAATAGIARPTATAHLNALVAGGVLTEVRQGRHRYLRLAGPEQAQLIEDLATLAGRPAPARSLRTVRAAADLSAARTCYDHLAGVVGVTIYTALVARGVLTEEPAVTAAGREWFVSVAGPAVLRPATSRPLVRTCLDWTQRQPHLGGALGAALCREFISRGWIERRRDSRAVRVTSTGLLALRDLLGIDPEPLALPA